MRTRINYSLILDLAHYNIVVIRVGSYSMRYKIRVRAIIHAPRHSKYL